MTDYTPDTGSVEIAYVYADEYAPVFYGERREAFQRWLNEERAKAWDLARSEVRSLPSWYNPETGKGGFDVQPLGPDASSEEGAWDAVMEILDQNPYRKANS